MDPLFEIEMERPIPGSRDAGRVLIAVLGVRRNIV
jgi:hypothetical protein